MLFLVPEATESWAGPRNESKLAATCGNYMQVNYKIDCMDYVLSFIGQPTNTLRNMY